MARRRGKRRRLAGLLVLLGSVAVLGTAFGAGYFVGRHGARVSVVTGIVKPRPPSESAKSVETPKTTETPKTSEPALPRLTFYQELTAPLAAPPRVATPRPRPVESPAVSEPVNDRTSSRAPGVPGRVRAPGGVGGRDPSPHDDQIGLGDPSRPPMFSEPVNESHLEPRPGFPGARARAGPGGVGGPVRSPHDDQIGGPSRPPMFSVQVAAYATRAQAEALRDRLGSRGFAAEVSEAETPGGTRYRVRIGTFPTRDEARAEADRVTSTMSVVAVVVRARAGAGSTESTRRRGERDTEDVRARAGAGSAESHGH